MIRRPPRSTLFSLHDALPISARPASFRTRKRDCRSARRIGRTRRCIANWSRKRSEEHTSELQSQSNLVCRLLLEKKKKKLIISTSYISYMQSDATFDRVLLYI